MSHRILILGSLLIQKFQFEINNLNSLCKLTCISKPNKGKTLNNQLTFEFKFYH